ncbi:MAG: hypothetical protein EXR75_00310 [Myxococcales bacterium]|nr:hypothetical protein [Myxococcales bacterium]
MARDLKKGPHNPRRLWRQHLAPMRDKEELMAKAKKAAKKETAKPKAKKAPAKKVAKKAAAKKS